ncbi:TIGR03118 family protein [Pelomonas sp. KK5]|uniref:TIGR03118 family protein n=1 Tax=Pelomonas sp. KK5 TaxID=1855730 RepID=UPI00097C3941|nr:TIGR03118 family protein [Pelomonas sp. KK5]
MTRNTRTGLFGLVAAGLLLAACGGGGGYGGGMGNSSGPPMASGFTVTSLVTDTSLGAYATSQRDTRLVNAWGVAFNPQGFVWVANNGTSTSTLYDGNGVPQSLVVTTPDAPTGIVFNASSTDFKLTSGGASGASPFIFATEGGQIAAWAPSVAATAALGVYDGSAGAASYKGLAIAMNGAANQLYATDFHNGRVDVFDAGFHLLASGATAFRDPGLPAGYAPFGIQALGGRIYVAYAKQDSTAHDATLGAGLGVVDVYDTAGALIKELVVGGALNAPWGLAMAPASGFGAFNGALLVGNFGDGKINAYDPTSGALLGTLSRSDGAAIVIDGLWGIAFGNGLNAQPTTTLFFAAGPNDETHGVYGRITAN